MKDYEMIYKISKKCPNFEFKIISQRFKNLYPRKIKNITNFGFNKNQTYYLSDQELKEIIQQAKCIVLPIKKTLQPSGQSVWDKKNMVDLHNCFLLKDNAKVSDWVKTLNLIFEKDKEFDYLTKNAYEEFIKNYTYDGYLSQWIEIINDL